ncbi:MAG: ATP synthase F1 subunit epsilon [Planctomycetota bacterium]
MSDAKRLRLTVITPVRTALAVNAQSVVVPAFDGELGVLPGHAALLSLLGVGEMRITTVEGQTRRLAIRGGFLQVKRNQVTVLTPESFASEEIKLDALQSELEKLNTEKPTNLDEREAWETNRYWVRARQRVIHA